MLDTLWTCSLEGQDVDRFLLFEVSTFCFRKLTQHLPYSLVIEKLSKHFERMTEDEDTGSDPPYETIEALATPIVNDSGSEEDSLRRDL